LAQGKAMQAAPPLLAAALTLFAPTSFAQRLLTESYEITIDARCAEGVVSCNDVRYTGVERRTGRHIRLRGEDMHTICADGVTPCRFLGQVFKRGKATYMVLEDGTLSIRENDKVVQQEKGIWQEDGEKSSWHGRWRAYTEGNLCKTEAIDGSRRFVAQIEKAGGNAWFYFETRDRLGKEDELLFRIEGRRPRLYSYDVSVVPAADEAARTRVTMPNGYAPEFIQALRISAVLAVQRAGTAKPETLQRFSLTGFSASFSKLAQWCRFDPDRLFQP